jgi:hypothetical protein
VQRNLLPVEHHQQFGFVGMQPRQQAIEHGEACAAREAAIEPGPHLATAARTGISAIRLEITLVPPDQRAHVLLRGAARRGSVKVSSL